jgi:hypothetical protein
MSFLLYGVTRVHADQQFKRVREVKIAGWDGPIAQYLATRNPTKTTPFPWHATVAELMPYLGASSTSQSIIIDLMPDAKHVVSLYRLCDVWGFSEAQWTPIALRFQSLFIEKPEPNPSDFKQSFSDAGSERSYVAEFLYLLGGVNGGTWNWGRVGRVNGALLWKNAFDFLAGEVGKSLGEGFSSSRENLNFS